MRGKEQGSEEEAEAHIYTTNFMYLPENKGMGKVCARVGERFNIEQWSINRKKKKLSELTSYIKINNEKPA